MAECKDIRRRILELAYRAGSNGSHLGGSLSAVEILNALYNSGINTNPCDESRDRVILSKGHSALALYCVLESKGILSKEEAETFEQNGTVLSAHARRDVQKGIEFSGGSLGLGISFAIGVALACKDKGLNNRIYVLLGDGECDEGLVWESVMAAVNYKLDNLVFIVDCNGLQSDGFTAEVMDLSPLENRFGGFGCEVVSVDGHSMSELDGAYSLKPCGRPLAIVAHTVKGKGVSFMENRPDWHHGTLSQAQYEQALEEVRHE